MITGEHIDPKKVHSSKRKNEMLTKQKPSQNKPQKLSKENNGKLQNSKFLLIVIFLIKKRLIPIKLKSLGIYKHFK